MRTTVPRPVTVDSRIGKLGNNLQTYYGSTSTPKDDPITIYKEEADGSFVEVGQYADIKNGVFSFNGSPFQPFIDVDENATLYWGLYDGDDLIDSQKVALSEDLSDAAAQIGEVFVRQFATLDDAKAATMSAGVAVEVISVYSPEVCESKGLLYPFPGIINYQVRDDLAAFVDDITILSAGGNTQLLLTSGFGLAFDATIPCGEGTYWTNVNELIAFIGRNGIYYAATLTAIIQDGTVLSEPIVFENYNMSNLILKSTGTVTADISTNTVHKFYKTAGIGGFDSNYNASRYITLTKGGQPADIRLDVEGYGHYFSDAIFPDRSLDVSKCSFTNGTGLDQAYYYLNDCVVGRMLITHEDSSDYTHGCGLLMVNCTGGQIISNRLFSSTDYSDSKILVASNGCVGLSVEVGFNVSGTVNPRYQLWYDESSTATAIKRTAKTADNIVASPYLDFSSGILCGFNQSQVTELFSSGVASITGDIYSINQGATFYLTSQTKMTVANIENAGEINTPNAYGIVFGAAS